jgi:heme/copper-type cytochrome/quinol oxidase subunit 1
MARESALQDTYYIVAHFDWITSVTAVSAVLILLSVAVRRWSGSRLAQRLRQLTLASWFAGLAINLGLIVAWQVIDVRSLIETPRILQILNDVSSVASFMLLLALAFSLAMIGAALWHRLFRSTS